MRMNKDHGEKIGLVPFVIESVCRFSLNLIKNVTEQMRIIHRQNGDFLNQLKLFIRI